VVELRGAERPDDGDLVHDSGEMGQELRELGAGSPYRSKEYGAQPWERLDEGGARRGCGASVRRAPGFGFGSKVEIRQRCRKR
jgi:hypothetical protein